MFDFYNKNAPPCDNNNNNNDFYMHTCCTPAALYTKYIGNWSEHGARRARRE